MLLSTKIDWPELYFVSEALPEEQFEDVSIVTLKNFYVETVNTKALFEVDSNDLPNFAKIVSRIMDGGEVFVHEHVDVSKHAITVYVDDDSVSDGAAFEAMTMLAQALDNLNGQPGKVSFGEPVTYKESEIPWLHNH